MKPLIYTWQWCAEPAHVLNVLVHMVLLSLRASR